MGIRVSTWVNHYVPQTKQYLFTEYEMGQGIGTQKIEVNGGYEKDLKKYADYIEAFYNDGRLNCFVENNTIKIVFTKGNTESDLTLEKFLNLRTTDEAEKNFSLKGNELIIGNVGPI